MLLKERMWGPNTVSTDSTKQKFALVLGEPKDLLLVQNPVRMMYVVCGT